MQNICEICFDLGYIRFTETSQDGYIEDETFEHCICEVGRLKSAISRSQDLLDRRKEEEKISQLFKQTHFEAYENCGGY